MTIASRLGSLIALARSGGLPPLGACKRNHAGTEPASVEWRFGIRFPGRRYYLNIRLGRERRAPDRLLAEGQTRLPVAAVFYGTVGSAFFTLFGVICFLYLLKSLAGINVMGNDSVLHPLYELFIE